MADRTVAVRLLARVDDYKRNMGSAADVTKKFGSTVAAHTRSASEQLAEVKAQSTVAGAGLLALSATAVVATMQFDKQMSAVSAAAGASAGELDALRKAALQAGKDTAYSATQAAAGIEELSKAGMSTTDILSGGLNGALSLAAAGGIEVADAAETAATALTIFRLQGNQASHVADLLAAGAGKAQGGVGDLAMALKQSGLVAAQTGLSIEDTAGALAMFASAGLLGSDGGTSFKSMLQRLTPQSKEAADLMEQLGITAYDASGQFIGLDAYAGRLRDSLSKLTPEQRNAAMATIFGSDAIKAATVLYQEGAEGVKEWREKVDDSGYAADQAGRRMDNLAGDIEKLKGSIETNLIEAGSGANGVLRFMVQTADRVAGAVGMIPGPLLTAGLAATTAAGAYLLLAPRIVATAEAHAVLAAQAPRATAALTSTAKAAGKATVAFLAVQAAAAAFQAHYSHLANGGQTVNELSRALDRLNESATNVQLGFESETGSAASFNEALATLANNTFFDNVGTKVANFVGFQTTFNYAEESIKGVDEALSNLVQGGKADAAAQAFDRLRNSFIASGGTAEQFVALFPQYRDAVAGATTSSEDLAKGVSAIDTASTDAKGAIDGLNAALEAFRGVAQSMDEANASLGAAIDDAADAVKNLNKGLKAGEDAVKNHRTELDLGTAAGRKAQAALGGIANSLFKDVIPAYAAAGAPISDVEKATEDARAAFIRNARAAGLTETAAEDLADAYGLIPKEVATKYSMSGVAPAKAKVDELQAALDRLPRVKNVRVQYTQQGAVQGTGGGRTVTDAAGGYVSGPGTSTSDSIPARLSNGEYVIKASSVDRYGRGFLDAVNAGAYNPAAAVPGPSPAVAAPSRAQVVVTGDTPVLLMLDGEIVATSLLRYRTALQGAPLGFDS